MKVKSFHWFLLHIVGQKDNFWVHFWDSNCIFDISMCKKLLFFMIFLHEIIIKKLVATHVFFELLIISFLCYYCSLLSEFWDLLFTITAACFYSISFSRFFFSLSLNFWNSSQPILFGGMLMPKFAALSNHTTWKCQRRKGKRCRIPKVKILPVITTTNQNL